MDNLLKSLKISDDKDKHPSQSVPAAVPQPTVAPGTEEHSGTGFLDKLRGSHHEAQQPVQPAQVPVAEPPKEKEHGFLGKLSDAISGEHRTQAPPPVPAAVAPEPAPTHHGVFDELTAALSGGKHANKTDPAASIPAPTIPPPAEEKHGLMDQLGKAFGHEHTPTPAPAPPIATPPEHQSLKDKILGHDHHKEVQPTVAVPPKAEGILDKLTHHHESAPAPQPPQHEGFLDKLGLHSKQPEPPKDQSLLDKISGKLHHEEPPKEQNLHDKIKSAFGGGAAGEAKEDHLDKAVDFVQEHILHQGSQDNESVMEQLKDKQIADAIRDQYKHVTGHELGQHDKDKKH